MHLLLCEGIKWKKEFMSHHLKKHKKPKTINTDIEKMLDFLRYLFIIIAGVAILLDLL